MSYLIYLVEDEENLNRVLTTYLEQEGWNVQSFQYGEEARKAMTIPPDLWILDIMLPDIDGYQLLREAKEYHPDVPIIFISARDEDIDRIIGLEMGSDDYLPKPFLPRELVIRTRKILERAYAHRDSKQGIQKECISLPPYNIYPDQRSVYEQHTRIELTSKEYDLLFFLLSNESRVLTREALLHTVWGAAYSGSDRVVDDLIRRLRKKMPQLRVETVYGYGYRMVRT